MTHGIAKIDNYSVNKRLGNNIYILHVTLIVETDGRSERQTDGPDPTSFSERSDIYSIMQ